MNKINTQNTLSKVLTSAAILSSVLALQKTLVKPENTKEDDLYSFLHGGKFNSSLIVSVAVSALLNSFQNHMSNFTTGNSHLDKILITASSVALNSIIHFFTEEKADFMISDLLTDIAVAVASELFTGLIFKSPVTVDQPTSFSLEM